MSRIGKQLIEVPGGATVTIDGQTVVVKGAKGQLEHTFSDRVTVSQGDDGLGVKPVDDSKESRQHWGMSRTLLANMIEGVSNGYKKNLEINGVGYRAAVQGKDLIMQLGFSHEVKFPIPEGIEIKTPKPTEMKVINGGHNIDSDGGGDVKG